MARLEETLRFAISNNKNVLLIGKHGVGKTTIIEKLWSEMGLKWQYFSAATMDPFIDFIGIPKEKVDQSGVSYLELVKPKVFANDEVEAIFFDEFNRSPKKVRNAVMELMQFKSINGQKFKNLRFIWAAVNPFDDDATYDVEKIDPAQLDRFHIHVNVPYKASREYFRSSHGEVGDIAVTWWDSLNDAQKDKISPRRLDYALQIYSADGDINWVLGDPAINSSELVSRLEMGKFDSKIKKAKDNDELKQFFSQPNNVKVLKDLLLNAKNNVHEVYKTYGTYLNYLSEDDLMGFLSHKKFVSNYSCVEYIETNFNKFPAVEALYDQAYKNKTTLRSVPGKIEGAYIRRNHKTQMVGSNLPPNSKYSNVDIGVIEAQAAAAAVSAKSTYDTKLDNTKIMYVVYNSVTGSLLKANGNVVFYNDPEIIGAMKIKNVTKGSIPTIVAIPIAPPSNYNHGVISAGAAPYNMCGDTYVSPYKVYNILASSFHTNKGLEKRKATYNLASNVNPRKSISSSIDVLEVQATYTKDATKILNTEWLETKINYMLTQGDQSKLHSFSLMTSENIRIMADGTPEVN